MLNTRRNPALRVVAKRGRMTRFLSRLILVGLFAAPAVAQVGPSTAPATRPVARARLGPITPATGTVAVPFTLSGTNHLIVRLKINGHGPYNFVMDTGAPTLLVDETLAKQIGLRPTTRRATTGPATRPAGQGGPAGQGWATIDRLDIEGGLSMRRVRCLVLTPYQITGMNAVGVAGMELHGLMGYSVLARFKIDIDPTRHRMRWTPQPPGFVPPPIRTSGPAAAAADAREDRLESLGGLLGILGPLVKSQMPGPPTPRGWVGIEFQGWGGGDGPHPTVDRVLGDSPAERAGVRAGDIVLTLDGHDVQTDRDVARATSQLLPGQAVRLTVRRGPATREITVTSGEGL